MTTEGYLRYSSVARNTQCNCEETITNTSFTVCWLKIILVVKERWQSERMEDVIKEPQFKGEVRLYILRCNTHGTSTISQPPNRDGLTMKGGPLKGNHLTLKMSQKNSFKHQHNFP